MHRVLGTVTQIEAGGGHPLIDHQSMRLQETTLDWFAQALPRKLERRHELKDP